MVLYACKAGCLRRQLNQDDGETSVADSECQNLSLPLNRAVVEPVGLQCNVRKHSAVLTIYVCLHLVLQCQFCCLC